MFLINKREERTAIRGGWRPYFCYQCVVNYKRTVLIDQLHYQKGNEQAQPLDMDQSYILTVSNKTTLHPCRNNQPVLGIDGKHGLQDDGACLQTIVIQHRDGFGCPAGFTVMSRENLSTIKTAVKAIVELTTVYTST
jgi:hypothetical protein